MPEKRPVYLLIFDGFADWEPALAVAEINKSEKYKVATVGFEQCPVVSMGGLRIIPDILLEQMDYQECAMFILPGGHMWEQGMVNQVVASVSKFREKQVPIAGICGATLFLANHGYLDNTPHTSNHIFYLKSWSETYRGDDYYKEGPCMSANGIITASGASATEFAYEIIKELKIYDESFLEKWYEAFKSGKIPMQYLVKPGYVIMEPA